MFAKLSLDQLDSIPEKPAAYPEFSMFRELPAWGIFIRHARDVEFNGVHLYCNKKDYRTAIVLDDVHHAEFAATTVKEVSNKKTLYQQKSSEIIFNKR